MSAPVTTPQVPAGRVVRSRSGSVSLRVRPRALLVGVALIVAPAVVGAVSLTTGEHPASVADAVSALVGNGPPGLERIVHRFRMPRLAVAIGVGAALGVSGAIFQSISRNPLGSPDVIGFTTGSATGALVVILLFRDGPVGVPLGAVLGGVATAVLVYLLAYRRGLAGFRLILVGIGVSAMLVSVNAFLLSRASLREAQNAQLWLIGTLNGRGWSQAIAVGLGLVVLLPVALALGRRMAMLEMGDEAATARGVPVERSRVALLLTGVGLTALSTAAAGPVGFVALAAPQVAQRLVRTPGVGLLPSALVGAVLLAGADLGGLRLFAPVQVPVGLSTAAVGGAYLAWLLVREWRR